MNELAIDTKDLAKTYAGHLRRQWNRPNRAARVDLWISRPQRGRQNNHDQNAARTCAPHGRFGSRVAASDARSEHIAILQRTAFVSEKKTLYPSLTPYELVRFSRGFYPTWSDSAVEKYARLFEIPMKQRFEKLSNGNQTKVWLLLALCQGADLLILDEPTTALDPITVDQLMHVLAEDAPDRGCTIFFSSHQLEEVERIAEYAGFIDHGKLLMEARLDDIKSEFRLITAAGNSLPTQTSSQVLSVDVEENFYRYVVTRDPEGFAAELSRNGATVTSIATLGLRDIFLQLIRKEQ